MALPFNKMELSRVGEKKHGCWGRGGGVREFGLSKGGGGRTEKVPKRAGTCILATLLYPRPNVSLCSFGNPSKYCRGAPSYRNAERRGCEHVYRGAGHARRATGDRSGAVLFLPDGEAGSVEQPLPPPPQGECGGLVACCVAVFGWPRRMQR